MSCPMSQGEIREGGGDVTGFHGWVQTYYTEQNNEFVYGNSDRDCGVNIDKHSIHF